MKLIHNKIPAYKKVHLHHEYGNIFLKIGLPGTYQVSWQRSLDVHSCLSG